MLVSFELDASMTSFPRFSPQPAPIRRAHGSSVLTPAEPSMSGTAICNPEGQHPKQTGAYASAEAQELLASLAQPEPRISQSFQ